MNPSIRPLTADERRMLAAARLVAVESAPYLAHALFSVRPLAAVGLATFAVDRFWRLYVDPATLAEWGPQVAGAVLLHEACHLIRDHAGRADSLPGPVDHDRWNLATDAAINDDLIRAGLPSPSGSSPRPVSASRMPGSRSLTTPPLLPSRLKPTSAADRARATLARRGSRRPATRRCRGWTMVR